MELLLQKKDSIEEKLKAAAVKIMKKEGLENLSVRAIKNKLKEDFGEDVVGEYKAMIKKFIKDYAQKN
eukprot:1382303-Amorphochlora_amoeboformis.AAC.1